MSRRPFLVLGIASFLTTLAASSLSENTMWIVWATAALLLIIGLALCRRSVGKTIIAAALAAAMVTSLFSVKFATVIKPQLAYAEQTVHVTMRIYDSEPTGSGTAYVVRVEDGELPEGIRLFLWAGNIGVAPRTGDLLTGNVELHAAVYEENPTTRALASSSSTWLYAWPIEGYALTWQDGRDSMSLVQKALTVCREHIHNVLYRYLPPSYAALCESILMGERDHLDETLSENFRVCGVYHVLAVSGLHLTVITGVVLAATRRLRKRPSTLIAMTATVLFMALCGFAPSVSRAGVMVLIVLSGRLFRRRADGLNSVGFAAFAMLLIDPFCGYDIGWQLSFAATLGLLAAFPVWQREVTARVIARYPRLSRPLSTSLSAVGVTVCASWATMPLLAWYFGEISTVFLVSNLICVPLATLLLVMALIGVLATMLWTSVGVGILVLCERICLWLDGFTAWLASFPYATIKTTHPLVVIWLFAFTAATAIAYMLWKKRGLRLAVTGMMTTLLLGVTVFQIYARDTVYVTVVDADAPVVIVQTNEGTGMVFAGNVRASASTEAVLRREYVDTLSWMVWADTRDTRRCRSSFEDICIEQVFTEAEDIPIHATEIQPLTASVMLDENVQLTAMHGAYRLDIEGTTVVICCADTDTTAMCEAWKTADLLVLSGKLTADDPLPDAPMTVVSGSWYTLEENKTAWGERFETVYYTAEQDGFTFLTRQNRNLSLRGY